MWSLYAIMGAHLPLSMKWYTTLKEAAVEYARRGWFVFPLTPNSKKPLPGSRGFKDASNDPAVVAHMWDQAGANCNIGLIPATSCLICVDVDAGANNEWVEANLPPTMEVWSPNGVHLYYSTDLKFGNGKLRPHIDIRSAHGYSILPPSVVDGRTYEWDRERTEIVPLPQTIVNELSVTRYNERQEAPAEGREDEGTVRAAQAWLDNQPADQDGYVIACGLVRNFGLGEEMAVMLFENWSSTLPWSWDIEDIERKVRNARKYGQDPIGCNAPSDAAAYGAPTSAVQDKRRFNWRTPAEAARGAPLEYWDKEKTFPKVPGVLVISAPQKSHKTGLAIKKCLDAVQCGAKVIYVAAEGGYGIDTARLPAAVRHRGEDLEALSGRWYTLVSSFNVLSDMEALLEDAPIEPDIIVFDTLTRVAGSADLNTSQAVQEIYRECDKLMERWGCLVVLIHHPKRGGTGASGSVQIESSAYATWHLEVEAGVIVKCWVDKMKDGKAEFAVLYQIAGGEGTPVITDLAVSAQVPISVVRQKILGLLNQMPVTETISLQYLADAIGNHQDTIIAHVRGDKRVKVDCDDLVDKADGDIVPKKPSEWFFRGRKTSENRVSGSF